MLPVFSNGRYCANTRWILFDASPIDIAISKISAEIWDQYATYAQAIPLQRFAKTHNPVKHELLFFLGYSGERSSFYFNNLISRGTPYLTQECPLPTGIEDVDSEHHFSLFYKPDLATSIDGTSVLPDPHGFSGSLIWDTKRAYCLQENILWDPSMAEITGIVWGWPSSDACILATKVEHFRLTDLISLAKKNN